MITLDVTETIGLITAAEAALNNGDSDGALTALAGAARRILAHAENRIIPPGEALLYAIAEAEEEDALPRNPDREDFHSDG